ELFNLSEVLIDRLAVVRLVGKNGLDHVIVTIFGHFIFPEQISCEAMFSAAWITLRASIRCLRCSPSAVSNGRSRSTSRNSRTCPIEWITLRRRELVKRVGFEPTLRPSHPVMPCAVGLQFGLHTSHEPCPLLGAKRTFLIRSLMSANDP